MLSLILGGLVDVIVENLPAIEKQLGRAAFVVEAERLVHLFTNGALAVQAFRQRLQDLEDANDAAVEAARKKPPTGGGNG